MTVYIVGAGLAGLSAAVDLAGRGTPVEVFEASAQAGGRCRSYHDPVLGMTIDNGNHFILSGNAAAFAYLRAIGAQDRLVGPADASLDFHDLRDGTRWRIRPNGGALPWWLFDPRRRVPGTRARDFLAMLSLAASWNDRPIGEVLPCQGMLWDRLLEPFLLGALNTEPAQASAALAGAVVRESFARGGSAYRVRIAHPTLSAAFVDPALAYLAARGARVRIGQPVRALSLDAARCAAFTTAEGETRLGAGDALILATPPQVSQALLPGLSAPDAFNAIVNGHFRSVPPPDAPPMLGVIGGVAQWIFAFPDRISVTVSGANALADENREEIARAFWRDIVAVHGGPDEPPPWRIVKERRATFAATPTQNAKRPAARTRWRNLALAGDWTSTGLPATIEGAIRSGHAAAQLALETASH